MAERGSFPDVLLEYADASERAFQAINLTAVTPDNRGHLRLHPYPGPYQRLIGPAGAIDPGSQFLASVRFPPQ